MRSTLRDRYGPWAVVTGASSGIGEAYAHRLASEGINLIIVARRSDRLETLAAELRRTHSVNARIVVADLSAPEGVEQILKTAVDVDVGIVVSNAGSTKPGAFLAHPAEDRLRSVRLNVLTTVDLAHGFGEQFARRGRGAFIFTGSTAAYSPVPMMASYAASKAFIGSFAEALHVEWKAAGVDVLVSHPGPTKTEMVAMDGVNFDGIPMRWMTPEQVAKASLKVLGKRAAIVHGVPNRMQRFIFTRMLPRPLARTIWGSLMKRATTPELHPTVR